MRQAIRPGGTIDALTTEEAQELFRHGRRKPKVQRVRAAATITLDANGNGQDEVYAVPAGMEFAARRVSLDLNTAADPSTGNVPLDVAGKTVEYLRSGTRIEYAVPQSPKAVPQVPGIQTWGDQQGPYLRNGEVFEVRVKGLTANAVLDVTVEGLLAEK